MADHLIRSLLVLCLFTASASGNIKLKSSGIHMGVPEEEGLSDCSDASLRQRRAVDNAVQVRRFHMKSTLYARFATVTIDSEVVNHGEGSEEVAFQVQVPEVAFMSNFTMVVDGKVHVAQVLEKKAAEERYQEAKERNQTAAQVKQVPVELERGMELFQIIINLASHATASFTLVYNELLERRLGMYRQRLVVRPGAIVDDLLVTATFAERQGFTSFAYTLPGSNNRLTASSVTNKTELRASADSRELIFRPTVEMQRQFDSEKGIQGEFTVYYSVAAEPEGGSIIVQKDYFAHFFSPNNLNHLPKKILFIIDISGSMSGQKIQQAQQAMLKILDDLKAHAADRFNILLFDDKFEMMQDNLASVSNEAIEGAKGFVRDKLVSRGGTNIHGALMKGLDKLLGEQASRSCDTADMIIFLTDGDPTAGVTDIDQIIRDVTSKNNRRASIYSLGFGFNLNFDFLYKLSDKNLGQARRIYDEGDAKDQLRTFYQELGNPVLCDVEATYHTNMVSTDFLTVHRFPLFFDGKEIIVAGKIRDDTPVTDSSMWDAELTGTGADGMVSFVVPAGKVQVVSRAGVEDDLTEKLWAYLNIKKLIDEADRQESEEKSEELRARALSMSLTYGFVTPLTSFSIVVEKAQEEDHMLESMAGRPASGNSGSNVKRMDSFDTTGLGFRLQWSYALVCCLLIGRFILP